MKIYIISHKDYDYPINNEMYCPLQVGTSINGKSDNFMEWDNNGNNISDKNLSYNELTGLYWIWKNSQEDIVGLCHYRRYFVDFQGKLGNVFGGKKTGFIDGSYVKRQLPKAGMIVHNKTFFMEGCAKQYRRTQKFPRDIDYAREIIAEMCPEYLFDFDKVMDGRVCHLLNMMIAPKEIFDEYCKWLFGILFRIEKELLTLGERDFSRRMGMLGERLLDVWLVHNHVEYKECFTINTERVDWKVW